MGIRQYSNQYYDKECVLYLVVILVIPDCNGLNFPLFTDKPEIQ